MKYTVLLTEESNGHIQATVPGLPDCIVEAPTRSEALSAIRKAISEILNRTEIVQLDVAAEPKACGVLRDTPWDWMGAFKNDPTWGELFDDIERQRNSN